MNHMRILSYLVLAIIAVSCASSPSSRNANQNLEIPDLNEDGIRSDEEELIFSLLQQANNSSSPESEFFSLEAARVYLGIDQELRAYELLTTLNTRQLDLPLSAEILFLRSQLLINQSRYQDALRLLTIDRFDAVPQLPINLQKELRLYRAQAYEALNNFSAALKERILIDNVLIDSEKESNHEQIWQDLLALPLDRLELLAENENIYTFQGWYQLGLVGKSYQYNLDRQLVALNDWQQRWIRHPATENLPQTLRLVETMAAQRPSHLALLLPLNTNAGTIIRDAFMSAYLNVQAFGGQVPSLRFYDTSKSSDIIDLHTQARQNGAEMIIGPLLKQEVAQLERVRNLGVPTLALNTTENINPASRDLYQFSLSPEEEARQLANKAWDDGHRFAAILSPLSPPNDSYNRKRDSFVQEWLSLGGRIVTQEFFSDNYTQSIESLLNIDASENRRDEISELINASLEFSPRRRKDIDLIFLIAEPLAARQIKPSLGYLFAGDIPVYATQDIYSGTNRQLEDEDLNGITFGESPWLLAEEDELKQASKMFFPQSSAQNLRLQAFGIDVFRLYPRIQQLKTGAENAFVGATGELSLDEDNRITRQLEWAQIEDGLARPLINNQ